MIDTIPTRCDVVVIGGGPAGCAAAGHLALRGYDVVLLERARHPRPVVGENLLPYFWSYADKLGISDDIMAAEFTEKAGGTSVWGGRAMQMTFSDFKFDRPALHVERDKFDHIMINGCARNGARVFEKVSVTACRLEGAGKNVVTYRHVETSETGRIKCRYVIDASGQNAIVARSLGIRQFDNDLRYMAFWGYFDDSRYVSFGGDIQSFDSIQDVAPTTLLSQVGDWGWSWHIPLKKSTSVGLVITSDQFPSWKKLGNTLVERFTNACMSVPLIRTLVDFETLDESSVQAVRDFSYSPTQLCGDGWYLAGDAAFFVDPINSAGVVSALYTGYLSGLAVDQSLQEHSRRTEVGELFRDQVRTRAAVYRLAAILPGHNTYPDFYELCRQGLSQMSRNDKNLLCTQLILVNRLENLAPFADQIPDIRDIESRFVSSVPLTDTDLGNLL
jgi:flavin-dependent dehydrogenase